jgi:hypothetical protein
MNIIRKIAKISLLVICTLVTAGAIIGMHLKQDEIRTDLLNIHPVEITVLIISITGILSLVFHIYSALFLYKQPKLVNTQIGFNIPSIYKYSTVLFSISLLSLEIQGYINNAFRFDQISSKDIIALVIIFAIAIWHLIDLYYYSKKITLHNVKVANELDQLGQE